MTNDHYKISCDFSKIVEETFELAPRTHGLNSVKESFIVVTASLKSNNCFLVQYDGKEIEIPKNWGVFNKLKSGEIKKLKDEDDSLNLILSNYFELSAEIFLGKNEVGIFLIFIKDNLEAKVA